MQIALMATQLGQLQILASARGLVAINLLDEINSPGEEKFEARRREGLELLQTQYPDRQPATGEALVWVKRVERLANGQGLSLSDLPPPDLGTRGTEPQRRVWQQLLAIPRGETISYSEMAQRVYETPEARRAAAAACAANPLPLLIPCHRVVAKGGGLGGFGLGLERKNNCWRGRSSDHTDSDLTVSGHRHRIMTQNKGTNQCLT